MIEATDRRNFYSNDDAHGRFKGNHCVRNREWGRQENATSNQQNNVEKRNENSNSGNSRENFRALQKSKETDFVEELCWDVQPNIEEIESNVESRVVSPRMIVQICNGKYPMLIDSSSQVTCFAEQFYNKLKRKCQLSELPVSNVSIHGALGTKATTIRQRIQLNVVVGKEQVVFPFLVVPSLSSKIIAGTDWQSHFRMVIDFENYI